MGNSEEWQRYQGELLEEAHDGITHPLVAGEGSAHPSPIGLPGAVCFPERELPQDGASRELRLKRFMQRNSATIADIAYSSLVHKPEFSRWRAGKLARKSVMAERIEGVLSGRRPLNRKPRQRPVE